jgi:hypothetical protein
LKYLKNGLFVILLAFIGLTVFGVSYKIGEQIFFVYKRVVKDSLPENVTKNSKEIPNVAVVPKADEPVAGEVKSGVKESVPVKIVEPASGQIEKVVTTEAPAILLPSTQPVPGLPVVSPSDAESVSRHLPEKYHVVANSDSRRYHLPGMKYYNKVLRHHRVIFPSEEAARQAGYHKAPR